MTSMQRAVAFDLGAESGRVFLGAIAGDRLRIEEVYRFPNEPVRYNGEFHWDISRLWLEVQRGLQEIGSRGMEASSLGLDTWGVDYALLGAEGGLLENPFHYRDKRTLGGMDSVLSNVSREFVYCTTGIQFMPINTLYQLDAHRRHHPEILQIAEHLLLIPDLFNFWLTGKICCEYTNASTTQLLDVRSRQWSQELISRLELPSHIFAAPIVEPGTVLGPLRPEISRIASCGDPLVVAPACHDTGSAVAAIPQDGTTAFLSSGTWSLLGAEVSSPVTTDAALRYNFTNEGGVCGRYRLLKNIAGLWLMQRLRSDWSLGSETLSYETLVGQAADAPAFRYFINPDHSSFLLPDNMMEALGAYMDSTGQQIPTTPGAYARAILEGLAFRYRAVLEQLEELTGRTYTVIRIVGGGSRNRLLNQFTADATGRRVLAGPVEAAVLGNLAMQLVALGRIANLQEARKLIDISFPPDIYEPRNSESWRLAYEQFLYYSEKAMERNDTQSLFTQRPVGR